MKKNKKLILIGLLITIIIVLISIVIYKKKTYSIGNNEYVLSRENMQDLVVSTALSYFYNHAYSNYEQYSMEKKQSSPYDISSFYFRNMTLSPEDVNRGNRLNIDCSAYTFVTYLYSIGYDMSEYLSLFDNDGYKYIRYNYSTNEYEYQTQKTTLGNAKDEYYNMYYNYGKEAATYTYSKIAAYDLAGYNTEGFASAFTKNLGQEYQNNSNANKNISVYFYKTKELTNGDYTETEQEKNQIKQNIENILKPGDIIVYRRKNRKENKIESGHAILYVGDAIGEGEKGIIHSTGTDYAFDDENYENIKPNDDSDGGYSIRYDTLDYFFNYSSGIFGNNENTATYSISILRPINRYCDNNECIIKKQEAQFPRYKEDEYSLSNAITRNELSNLRVEQYSTYETYNTSSFPTKSTTNSLNNGDKITYKLYMQNESKLGYCLGAGGSSTYNTEEKCKEKGYTWKTRNEKQSYSDLTLTGYIPNGTTFNKCNYNCEYNETENKVVWNNVSFSEIGYRTYNYEVTVNQDSDITNTGMTIETTTGNILHMGKITTKVNPTFSKNDVKNIENTRNSLDNNATSQLDYINKLYSNTYGLDLNQILTEDNIKNAVFKNKIGEGYNIFSKIIESEVSKITNDNYKKINQILVPGMYGGRLVKGNDNLDRIKYITTFSYEYGDIIITFDNNANNMKAYMFAGRDENGYPKVLLYDQGQLIEYTRNTTPSGYNMLARVFAQDLFVVLRPSRLGTTVRLEYKNANESLVMFNKYKYLNANYNIKFDKTNLEEPISEKTSKLKVNWYSDKDYKNKISENDSLLKTNTHTLYGQILETEKVELPNPQKEGYQLKWYSDSTLKSFVGNGGEEITPTSNMTLYAKYIENPIITLNPNGGTWENQSTNAITKEIPYGSDFYFSTLPNVSKSNEYGECTLNGWQEKDTDKVFKEYINVTKNREFNASWNCPSQTETYKVTYNANGGEGAPSIQTKEKDVSLTLSNTKPTKNGYIFEEWNTKEDGTGTSYLPGTSYSLNEDIILFAKWIEVSDEDRLESLDEKIIIDKSNLIIKGLDINTKIDIFAPKLDTTYTVKYYDRNNQELLSTDIMKTGNIIKFINAKNESIDMQISVKGDTTGDGNMNVMDIVDIANHITKTKTLNGVYYTSGDYDSNNTINVMDIVNIANKILNK